MLDISIALSSWSIVLQLVQLVSMLSFKQFSKVDSLPSFLQLILGSCIDIDTLSISFCLSQNPLRQYLNIQLVAYVENLMPLVMSNLQHATARPYKQFETSESKSFVFVAYRLAMLNASLTLCMYSSSFSLSRSFLYQKISSCSCALSRGGYCFGFFFSCSISHVVDQLFQIVPVTLLIVVPFTCAPSLVAKLDDVLVYIIHYSGIFVHNISAAQSAIIHSGMSLGVSAYASIGWPMQALYCFLYAAMTSFDLYFGLMFFHGRQILESFASLSQIFGASSCSHSRNCAHSCSCLNLNANSVNKQSRYLSTQSQWFLHIRVHFDSLLLNLMKHGNLCNGQQGNSLSIVSQILSLPKKCLQNLGDRIPAQYSRALTIAQMQPSTVFLRSLLLKNLADCAKSSSKNQIQTGYCRCLIRLLYHSTANSAQSLHQNLQHTIFNYKRSLIQLNLVRYLKALLQLLQIQLILLKKLLDFNCFLQLLSVYAYARWTCAAAC